MKPFASRARDLAIRVAGANHSRRLYGTRGRAWARTLDALHQAVTAQFEDDNHREVTVGLLGDGLAVLGVPIHDPPSSVVRFISKLVERDVEIIVIRLGVTPAELETLLAYLGADSADVAAVRADAWLAERGVEHISIKHLRLMAGDGTESFRDVYFRGKRVLDREFSRASKNGAVSATAVGDLAKSLMEVILEADTPVATLLALRDRDDFALVHSVNVATLAGSQAGALGLPEHDVQKIVSAALTHDIGKTKVPEPILTKGAPLTDGERALLDAHTVQGARILLETPGTDSLAAIVALRHHSKPVPDEPGLCAVELCKIADTFDVIRSLRPFDDPDSMRGAVAYMVRRLRSRFNPYLLERFAALVELAPAGTPVALSSGEIGEVVEAHPELALHPVVQVLETRRGQFPAGHVVNLAIEGGAIAVPAVPPVVRDLDPTEIDDLG